MHSQGGHRRSNEVYGDSDVPELWFYRYGEHVGTGPHFFEGSAILWRSSGDPMATLPGPLLASPSASARARKRGTPRGGLSLPPALQSLCLYWFARTPLLKIRSRHEINKNTQANMTFRGCWGGWGGSPPHGVSFFGHAPPRHALLSKARNGPVKWSPEVVAVHECAAATKRQAPALAGMRTRMWHSMEAFFYFLFFIFLILNVLLEGRRS